MKNPAKVKAVLKEVEALLVRAQDEPTPLFLPASVKQLQRDVRSMLTKVRDVLTEIEVKPSASSSSKTSIT